MKYKTILVYLPCKSKAERLIKIASNIAKRFDSHLIGLHIESSIDNSPEMIISEEFSKRLLKEQESQDNEIKEVFLDQTQNEDFVAEWRSEKAASHRYGACLLQHARCVDLIIMAQSDPERDDPEQKNIQREIIEGSGHPVLIIPNYGDFDDVGEKVLVGWSGTREAARAVYDGIPLLQGSHKTEIFWVSKMDMEGGYLEDAAREIAVCLHRHGVKVNLSHHQESGLAIGDELLNKAADSGSDLIVSGAYGHSRIYDLMVGATTPHLMKHMTVPVLFSC